MKTFDCENCHLSWEDRSYEGECKDCGCMVYGDYLGGGKFICKLPKFIKKKIAKWKQQSIDKQQEHQYDGIEEWFKKEQKREIAMRAAIKEILLTDSYNGEELFICCEYEGNLCKLDTDSLMIESPMRLIWRYEELLKESEDFEEKE